MTTPPQTKSQQLEELRSRVRSLIDARREEISRVDGLLRKMASMYPDGGSPAQVVTDDILDQLQRVLG